MGASGHQIALLLGAGASCPFGYPTAKEFFERLDTKITNNHLAKAILGAFKQTGKVKDIEHVLQMIDGLLETSSKLYVSDFLFQTVKGIGLVNHNISWAQFIDEIKVLKSIINDELYHEYHFKPKSEDKAFKAFDDLFGVLNNANIHSISKDIFSLNYDRVLEEYFIHKGIKYRDGFSTKSQRRIWNPFFIETKEKVLKPFSPMRILKLHGSLNWREWNDEKGTIESVSTEEPSRSSKYKRNIFIYPTENCDESKEPYKTLYKYFKQLKERADVLVIIGYAFRDEAINKIIVDFGSSSLDARVIVISPTGKEDLEKIDKGIVNAIIKEKFLLIQGSFPDPSALQKLGQNLINIP